MLDTAKAILARGDVVVMFPEGTRVRPGALGKPRRGVGRLALETGAPVVPVAVIGTEDVRRGWLIRPRKVRIRVGQPLTFPRVEQASGPLAAAVTDRIWPSVMLQWEWLGGLPPLRRAAVVGEGPPVAELLEKGGLTVDVVAPGEDAALSGYDLVVLAVDAAEIPAAVEAHGDAIPPRAGVLVLAHGVVPPYGTEPVAYVAERTNARAVAGLRDPEGSPVLEAHDRAFARQLREVLRGARPKARDAVGATSRSAA
jgi:hypothetical protein